MSVLQIQKTLACQVTKIDLHGELHVCDLELTNIDRQIFFWWQYNFDTQWICPRVHDKF